MTEVTPADKQPIPAAMPMLLSFVAGYVDSYTYLGLFGLFVAQVTSSFVIAGAELVTHSPGISGKMLALMAFVFAAALTAALIGWVRDAGRAALPWMLALEAVLLVVFAAILLLGPKVAGATDWHGIVSGIFAAMAMGAQSVLVRLLMKGIPQTNVMTGNMTQLGIAMTGLVVAWRRFARSRRDAAAMREFARVRDELLVVLSVAIGFLAGAAAGAVAFVTAGLDGALLPIGIVAALALWALYRENSDPSPRGTAPI